MEHARPVHGPGASRELVVVAAVVVFVIVVADFVADSLWRFVDSLVFVGYGTCQLIGAFDVPVETESNS